MIKARTNRFIGFFLSSLMGALAVTFVAYATSVGTNVSVSGTLGATGLTTLSGSLQASSTALFGGATTFYGNLTVDKAATTTVTFNQAGINFDSNTFVIDPNANMVGIGTSSPTVMFSVHGSSLLGSADADTLTVRAGTWTLASGATTTVAMPNGINFDSNTFVIDSNANRIGIGTSSPSVMFSVHGSSLLGSADADTLTIRAGTWSLSSSATTTVAMVNGLNFKSNLFVIDPNSSLVGIGTSSPAKFLGVAGDTFIGSTGTTTLYMHTTTANRGSCIEFTRYDGSKFRAYATTTGPLQLESGVCK